jgi:hypothetical protein
MNCDFMRAKSGEIENFVNSDHHVYFPLLRPPKTPKTQWYDLLTTDGVVVETKKSIFTAQVKCTCAQNFTIMP